MTPRRILFWIHLTAGCAAGVVILVMSVTGVLLAPKRQIIAWADHSFQSQPAPEEQRLRLEELLTAVQAAQGRMPSGIIVRSEPAAPVAFDFGRERTLFVNPYSNYAPGRASLTPARPSVSSARPSPPQLSGRLPAGIYRPVAGNPPLPCLEKLRSENQELKSRNRRPKSSPYFVFYSPIVFGPCYNAFAL